MDGRLLIVDDEEDILSVLKEYFLYLGYTVFTAGSGAEALEKIKFHPDLILLDINLPDVDGMQICRQIRDYVSCPILFLSARVEEEDRIRGFASGGDDYILKPFRIRELGARVAAHLRREARNSADSAVRFFGKLAVDYSQRTVRFEETQITLTKTEFDIVELLSEQSGQIYDRERIYEKIRGFDADGDSSVIAEHIRRIRGKLKSVSGEEYIRTIWGVGYQWCAR